MDDVWAEFRQPEEEEYEIPAATETAGLLEPRTLQQPAADPWAEFRQQPQQQQQQQPAVSKKDEWADFRQPETARPEAEGAVATGLREAAGATPAALGGLAAGAATAGALRIAGAAGGRIIGGALGAFGGPGGAIAGWLGGGYVGGYLADEAINGIKKFLGFDNSAQRAANREANPMSAAAGQVAPLVLGLSPGRGAQVAARALSGGVGGAIEAGTQVAEGEFSKERLAANVIGGVLLPGNKQWLSNIESRAAARAGGRPPEAPSAPGERPVEQPVWPENTWPEGAPGPMPDWPGGLWPEGQPAPPAREYPTPPPGESPVWPDSTWPNEEPQPSGRTDRQGFTPGGRYEEPRPGAGPAEPAPAPADTPVAPHGTAGSEGAAGTAEAQPPPAGSKAGGPEDWGKKTAPAEGDNGINVGDVDPTLAHTLKAETPAAAQPAQQAGPMADIDQRLNFALHGEPDGPKRPAVEVPGELRKIAEDYRKMGQLGQVEKIEAVAKAIEANLPPAAKAPPVRAAALEQPQDVLKGPAPAVPPKAEAAIARSRAAPERTAPAPEPIVDRQPANVAGDYKVVPNPAGAGHVIQRGTDFLPGVYPTKGPAFVAMNKMAREAPAVPPKAAEAIATSKVAETPAVQERMNKKQLAAATKKAEAATQADIKANFERGRADAQSGVTAKNLQDTPGGRAYQEGVRVEQEKMWGQPAKPAPVPGSKAAQRAEAEAAVAAFNAKKKGQQAQQEQQQPRDTFDPGEFGSKQQQRQEQPGGPAKPPPPGVPPPSGEPPKPPAGSVEAAHAAISARIAPPASRLDKIPTNWTEVKKTANDFYTAAKDALHPLRGQDEFYTLARLTAGLSGRVERQLERGTYDIHTGEKNGKALTDVLTTVKDDPKFVNYTLAKRAIELNNRGIETGISTVDANKVVAAEAAKYEPVFRELVAFQDRVLDNLHKSGVLGAGAIAKMRAMNKEYIPFYRLLDPNSDLGQQLGVGKGVRVSDPTHKIKGSERQIIDPIDSIVKNTYLFTDISHKNIALQALEDWKLKNDPKDQFMRLRKDTPVKGQHELNQFIAEHGINKEAADALAAFQRTSFQPGESTVRLFRDGKARTYDVADPAVAKAINAMDKEGFNLLTTILKQPASWLRAGAVLSPEFIARNPVRDQIMAFIQSKHGYIPVYDMIRGMKHLFKKTGEFDDWLTHGGSNSTLTDLDRKAVGINPKDYVSQVKNVIKSPIEALRVASAFMENATRMGEYLRAIEKGKSKTEAAFASREVALDYARMGAKAKALNAIIPFFNAQIEGIDRIARAFKDNPSGTLMKVGTAVTLPSVALWFANKDDPRYQELPQWQKDLFWIIPTDSWTNISASDASKLGKADKRQLPNGTWQRNDGTIYRIPKPFEIGLLFGSLPERALEAFYRGNPQAFKNLGKTVFEGFTPSVIPQAIVPFTEQFANRSTFTGQTLVPKHLEGLPAHLQTTPQTSETAKILGNIVSNFTGSSFASPIIIDNYIKQYTGGLGKHIVDLVFDNALVATGAVEGKVAPTSTAADMPLLKAFVARYPSSGAQSVEQFYDTYGERKKANAEIDFKRKRGESTAGMERENPGEAVHKMIGTLHKRVRDTYEDRKLTPDQKRTIIDTTYSQIIEQAKRGNEIFERTKRRIQ